MGVAERWMPATAGLLFAPPLVGFAWLLKSMPPPTAADVAARQARTPMDAGQRRVFLRRNGWVVGWVVAAYAMITVLRGLRADFAPELWTALGYPGQPSVFTRSEVWVALGVLMANAVAVRWHDNTAAFRYGLGISLGGVALVMGALAGKTWGDLEGFLFMVLLGLGLYLPYVAVHTTLLERLVARAEDRANLGFVMYLADAGGYVAYAAVLLLRGRGTGATVSLGAFSTLTWWLAGVAALAFGMVGWLMRTSATREPRPE
jgi:hypothetical protein